MLYVNSFWGTDSENQTWHKQLPETSENMFEVAVYKLWTFLYLWPVCIISIDTTWQVFVFTLLISLLIYWPSITSSSLPALVCKWKQHLANIYDKNFKYFNCYWIIKSITLFYVVNTIMCLLWFWLIFNWLNFFNFFINNIFIYIFTLFTMFWLMADIVGWMINEWKVLIK